MDIQSDFLDPATPGTSFNNVSCWTAEDSGYHTSCTPGSLECTGISNEDHGKILEQSICLPSHIQVDVNSDFVVTPELNLRGIRQRSYSSTCSSSFADSPISKRGVKRPYLKDETELSDCTFSSVPTPTNGIAGGIQKLHVNDSALSRYSTISNLTIDETSLIETTNNSYTFSYPTTPVKKIKSSSAVSPLSYGSHNSSPPRRRIPLLLESQGLQHHSKPSKRKLKGTLFKPNQKIDIVKMLWQRVRCHPAIMKIFSFLSNEDIYRFSLVSPTWLEVCANVSTADTQRQDYIRNTKENLENKDKGVTPKKTESHHTVLKENCRRTQIKNAPSSPPGTPRTTRFRKFTKAALLDTRLQLSCVRCRQPAKVNEEESGEQWVECSSSTCSYMFCRFCKCERHVGKKCFQFDLDGPSPSKRKKTSSSLTVGSKKSKQNLRRLLPF